MTTNELVSFLNQLPFVIIAIVTLYNAIRRPRRAAIDIALLFGALAAIVVIGWTVEQIELLDHPASTTIQVILLIALPYLLLRIVSDFMAVRSWIVGSAAVLFVALASAIVWFNEPLPDLLTIITATYFIVLVGYASWKFVRGARVASGVTARRLYAASTGSALLSLVVAVIAAQAVSERFNTFGVDAALQTLVVTTGLSYFVAFSPPSFLRRAWQEPELRALLARVAVLPRLPERTMIVRELEAGAAATLGARGASIGLWDLDRQTLVYPTINGGGESSENIGITGQVFASERPHFSENAPRDDPGQADIYRRLNAIAILAAPITAGTRRLGVLAVYAERPPIFADDDLRLVELLADQAAVILESHFLIDEAARVQARAEATRLRDDFLVAAAHDLRTPLTAAIARAQFLYRRARSLPSLPIQPEEVRQIADDLGRIGGLMTELLDAARAEHGKLLDTRQSADLVALLQQCITRHDWTHHRCCIETPDQVVAECDPLRIAQVIDNLLENAIKYSPNGGDVTITAAAGDTHAHISIRDQGIGIPATDLPHIFERFHRASNADMTTASGMGLGLFICKSIIDQHGGTIEANSAPGGGTTFEIRLPMTTPSNRATASAAAASALTQP